MFCGMGGYLSPNLTTRRARTTAVIVQVDLVQKSMKIGPVFAIFLGPYLCQIASYRAETLPNMVSGVGRVLSPNLTKHGARDVRNT